MHSLYLFANLDSIIAVHGLDGHAYGTWAHYEAGQPGFEAMWLRDFLLDDVKEARILVYGYNSALLGSNTSVSSVKDFAHDLLQRIIDDRADQVRYSMLFKVDAQVDAQVDRTILPVLAQIKRCSIQSIQANDKSGNGL